jgi:hypothetical protein
MVIEFLDDYGILLDQINEREQLFDLLLDWQTSDLNRERAMEAQDEINATFFCEEDSPRRLVSNHPLTTAVGGLQGLVVIAANPGYDVERNQEEMQFRATAEGNRDFCQSFFGAAAELTQQISWWRAVAKFAFAAMTGEETNRLGDLWQWAHATGCLGSVDLVPFHSASDGITGLIQSPNPMDNIDVRLALRNTARQTLNMVLRLQPQAVVIASSAGTRIIEEILAGMAYQDHLCPVGNDWGDMFQYKVRHYVSNETHIFLRPGQLFSKKAGLGGLQGVLATKIYELM